jgi:ArsR family transcriptional regulator
MATTATGWTALAGAKPLVEGPLTVAQADAVAGVLRILSDPVRLRLVSLLASYPGGEARLRDLAKAFTVFQPTVSYHLRILREAGIAAREQRAKTVFYRVVPESLSSIAALLDASSRVNQP